MGAGLGVRQAAGSAGIGRSVVSKTTLGAEAIGLIWPGVEALSDQELEAYCTGRRALPRRAASSQTFCTFKRSCAGMCQRG